MSSPPLKIAIFGSGVVGLSSAYYLLTSPLLPPNSTVTLIENASIAAGASSYAGGFIAGGPGAGDAWQGAPSRDLARLSWKCHEELAGVLHGAKTYGWRACGAVGLRVGEEVERSAYRILPEGVKMRVEGDWLEGEREDMSGEGGGVGQLDPALFCAVMYAHLQVLGCKTIMGEPTGLGPRGSDGHRTLSLNLHGKATSCLPKSTSPARLSFSHFLVAAGPWSAALCQTLSLPPIALTNLPGHSILIRPSASHGPIPSEAVFAGIGGGELGVHAATSGAARALTDEEVGMGYTRSPELFPRADRSVYVAGENSIPSTQGMIEGTLPNRLPGRADEVGRLLDVKLVARLRNAAAAVSPALRVSNGAIIEKEQICYRPITPDGESLIGELEPGVFVATGAGPWGITLAPGTGKVISEMLLAPAGTIPRLSADISQLRLDRFKTRASKL